MLRDFPDRLSPVLVKELRQGLRTRMFVIPFLVLHGLLVISSVDSRSGTGIFWACLIIMLVAVLPMRNTAALSDERTSNTLDTLMLTRLTPWRIVWGKWSATFALTLLTAVSVLPYLLVRYLNGGSSFLQEGAVLAALVLNSGALTAFLTALSSLNSALLRNLFAVLAIIMAWQHGCWPLLRNLETESWMAGVTPPLLLLIGWAVPFFLCHAAASIAPAALNLTTPRRLVTAWGAGVAAAFCFFDIGKPDHAESVLMAMLVTASMVEMGDRPSLHLGVGAAFARRGLPGRLAALFLHPGWATGVVFCAVLWWAANFLVWGQREAARLTALCFLPVVMGAPLFARRYHGTVVMLLGAALVLILSSLFHSSFLNDFPLSDLLLPSLSRYRDFPPVMAAVYALAALALAAPSLTALLRRISRESNL
jgi:hypothetical protein